MRTSGSARPFDAATKPLVEVQPSAWLDYLGLTGTQADLVEADLTTVTAEADKVLRVGSTVPYLAHIEFQSTYEADMDERVLHYNILLFHRHRLREADGPEVTGAAGYDLGLDSRERLEQLAERLLEVESWPELLRGSTVRDAG